MLLIKHYLLSIIIEDCGKTEGTGTPWRNRRQRQDPPFTFFLCPAAMLPGFGTEGPVCTYRRTWERIAHRASTSRHRVSKGMSWKGWWGQSAKKPVCLLTFSCFLNVGWGSWEGLEQEGELCRQQCGSLIRTDPKGWWCRRSGDVGLKHIRIHSIVRQHQFA